ncbi:MAG: hypothetical protein KDA93_17585 [Planctomycetaceae bacterium]|nr:hypothetical protein [Planctomycetaceae bacterium]
MDLSIQQSALQQRRDDTIAADSRDPQQVEECAIRLVTLSERLSRFLSGHVERLQEAAREIKSAAQLQAKYEAMTAEFTKKQQEWERHREAESQRMAADARLLSDAWDQIENERRERLSHGHTHDMPSAGYSTPEVSHQETQASPAPQTNHSLSDTALFDMGVPKSAQPSTVQFQQLKREIRQHARRSR